MSRVFLIASFALEITALSTFAQEQKLPDAAAVAGQIGQKVAFEDVVKAVSKSRTHDGYYLSFGAPYPKQVLSVWADTKLADRLPGAGHLIGRTVRIEGIVYSTPTGPILNLESVEHFHLLPADPTIISKAKLDGKTERNQFVNGIWQHLKGGDFDTVETLGRELQESHERFTDGTWMLDSFFHSFGIDPDRSTKIFEERALLLNVWKARYPMSILPIFAEVHYHIDLALKWRGNLAAAKVTPEQWQHFNAELSEARRLLESNPQLKVSPEYFVEMERVALYQGWNKDDFFRIFDEAVRREPEYERFYFVAAYYLLPWWHGGRGDWEDFAEVQSQKFPGPKGDALYARIAWSQADQFHHHLFDKTTISWPKMAAGFAALIQQNPDSEYLKNAYAYFAWEARDRERLAPALDTIAAKPDMEFWVNLENLQLARRFAGAEN
jgi:hypothetical protein